MKLAKYVTVGAAFFVLGVLAHRHVEAKSSLNSSLIFTTNFSGEVIGVQSNGRLIFFGHLSTHPETAVAATIRVDPTQETTLTWYAPQGPVKQLVDPDKLRNSPVEIWFVGGDPPFRIPESLSQPHWTDPRKSGVAE